MLIVSNKFICLTLFIQSPIIAVYIKVKTFHMFYKYILVDGIDLYISYNANMEIKRF